MLWGARAGLGSAVSEIDRFFDEMEERGEEAPPKMAKERIVSRPSFKEGARPPSAKPRLFKPKPKAEPEAPRKRESERVSEEGGEAMPPAPAGPAIEPPIARETLVKAKVPAPLPAPPIEGISAGGFPTTPAPPPSEEMINEKARVLLTWTINGHEEIRPTRGSYGYSFPEVNKLLNMEDARPLLEELASKGYYSKKAIDHIPSCPNCGSLKLHDEYICPYCHKGNLAKGVMLEHYPCGHVDFLEKFEKNGSLICPKCGKALKLIGTDYRRIEGIFLCSNCNRKFSVPSVQHVCDDCKTAFGYEKAELKPVYSYVFNEEMRGKVIAEHAIALPIAEFMRGKGCAVSVPGMLGGKSGAVHSFDIVATKGDKNVVITIYYGGNANQAIITLFAKSLDVGPERSIFISLGDLTAEARGLAQLYGITIIEGKNAGDVIGKLGPILDAFPAEAEKHLAKTLEGKVEDVLKRLGVAPEQLEGLSPPSTTGTFPPEGRPAKSIIDASEEVRKLRERIKGLLGENA